MTQSTTSRLSLGVEVQRWLENAPATALECREMRHAWRYAKWTHDNYEGQTVWARELECMRGCGVTRTMRRARLTGELLTSTYSYPPSPEGNRSPYLLPPGSGGLTGDELFLFSVSPQDVRPARRRKARR